MFWLEANHPRVCGSTTGPPSNAPPATEPSPHLREHQVLQEYLPEIARTIPASAGAPKTRPSSMMSQKNHPRHLREHQVLQEYLPEIAPNPSPHLREHP